MAGRLPLDANGDSTDVERKAVPVSEETPQFRDIYMEDMICRGARTAVVLQGLPEMPIRSIHLRNVSITAEAGMVWMDADNITLDNVEIVNRKGPVLTLFNTTEFRDRSSDVFGRDRGGGQGGRHREFQHCHYQHRSQGRDQDVILANGATADALQVK